MHRRRFMLGGASALALPLVGACSRGGGDDSPKPVPIPASEVVIRMPADQYMHRGAPTEWWWHIGTLRAGDRVFGFEINAASFTQVAFTQIMLTDVKNARHLQRTTFYVPPLAFDPNSWAEFDVVKDWSAALGSPVNLLSGIAVTNPGSGYTSAPTVEISGGGGALALAVAVLAGDKVAQILLISPGVGFTSLPTVTLTGGGGSGATARAFNSYATMNAAWPDPTKNMAIKARLVDDPSLAVVDFDLTMSQQGPVFMVHGTGLAASGQGSGGHLQANNYYYSLTKLQTTGTITVDGERFQVSGTTWMDHEYGWFGTSSNPVKWILQDMQLDNGVSISNYAILGTSLPALNERRPSNATVMRPDGTTYYEPTFITPIDHTWTSPASGKTYFPVVQVDMPSFNASFVVRSLIDGQEFTMPGGGGVYEGVASATGTFEGQSASGAGWNEQAMGGSAALSYTPPG